MSTTIKLELEEIRELNNYYLPGLPREIEAALYGLEIKPLDAGNLIDLPKPSSSNLKTGDDYILYGQLLKEYAEQEAKQNEILQEWREQALSLASDTKKGIFYLSNTSDFRNNEIVFDSILAKALDYSTHIKDMSFEQATSKHSCDKFKKSFYAATEMYLELVELFDCRTETKFEGLLKSASKCFLPFILIKEELTKKKKNTVKELATLEKIEVITQSMADVATILARTIETLEYSGIGQNYVKEIEESKNCKALFSMILAHYLMSTENAKKN